LTGFADYEVVELLLSWGRRAKTVNRRQRSPQEIQDPARCGCQASMENWSRLRVSDRFSAFGIKLMQDVAREYLKEQIIDKPYMQSSQAIYEYLYHSMRDLKMNFQSNLS